MNRIKEDIKKGSYAPSYLLYGEEAYLKKWYRDKLKEAIAGSDDSMNYRYYEGKNISVEEIIDLAETMPFLAERRLIIIEGSGLFKSAATPLADYLKEQAESTCFVFVEDEVDKRGKMYKAVKAKGYPVEIGRQNEKTLMNWILGTLQKENKKISRRSMELFLEKAGPDMENIEKELEKLICYTLDRDIIEEQDIESVCTTQISNKIFDMVNAIAEKKQKQALELYYDLLLLKEPPMRILFLIARQFQLLMQVKNLQKRGFDKKEIGTKTGLHGFIAGKYIAQSRTFSTDQLRGAVESCVQAEEEVKTGKLNDVISVEILIVKCSRA